MDVVTVKQMVCIRKTENSWLNAEEIYREINQYMQKLNLTEIVLGSMLHLVQRNAVYLYHLRDYRMLPATVFPSLYDKDEDSLFFKKTSLYFTTLHGVTSQNTILLNSHRFEKIEASMTLGFNPLNTKRRLLYLKTQFVPGCCAMY